MERKLNEVERARAIYVHLSQFCKPQIFEDSFWKIWEQFEVYYGNQDSFDDFLRIKRTVQLRYAVVDPVLTAKQTPLQVEEAKEIDEELVKQSKPAVATVEKENEM
jgi:pre-mRNA-splicing factor SYF1